MKEINNGENIRRTKAVLAAPGVTLKDAAMAYGSLAAKEKSRRAAARLTRPFLYSVLWLRYELCRK